MRRLLIKRDRRCLDFVEILFDKDDWMSLPKVAKKLGCSNRVLKDDIAHLKKTSRDFTVQTSYKGIRLVFYRNKGLKTLYKSILERSLSFQLLETLFLYENRTSSELANNLFVSASTFYRMVNQINELILEYGFHIETNPYRLSGSEGKIRYFFYQYFSEKYSRLEWPFEPINQKALDHLLKFFIDFTQFPADFAYFNVFKLVSAINLIRYKNGNYLKTDDIKINFSEILPDLSDYKNDFQFFEDTEGIKINNHLIKQIFTPYIQNGFSLNHDRLIAKTRKDKTTLKEYIFLEKLLESISEKTKIPLLNKEEIILAMHNSSHLEYQEPRSGYILYNHNQFFAQNIKDNFPDFFDLLYKGMKSYRKLMEVPVTEDGINYLIYNLFTYWKNLVVELRKRYEKINILIISDGHVSHSYMIKDFIEYEFSEQLKIDIYNHSNLSLQLLENFTYDIIITNFPIPALNSKRNVYIENIPTYNDLFKLQTTIDEIILQQNN